MNQLLGYECSRWEQIEFIFNTLNHIIISFISIYISWMCIRLNFYKTALHAWLCTTGYSVLMVEGIMSFYSGNILMYTTPRKTKATIHWILMVIGGGLGIIGASIKISQKTEHFTSVHGITGLIATIISAYSLISGICSYFSQNLKDYMRCQPITIRTLHVFLGLLTIIVGLISQFFAYDTGFFQRKVETDFAYMMKAFTLISLILTIIGPIKTLINKIKTMREK